MICGIVIMLEYLRHRIFYFVVSFRGRLPVNCFNESYIAGQKNDNIGQTKLGFALIMSEMDLTLNSA